MKLNNTNGIEETIIDEQVKKYFFNAGYLHKNKGKDYFYNIFGKFYDEFAKIINNERLTIAKDEYKSGLTHEFL